VHIPPPKQNTAGLQAEVAAFRAENAWVEESAVFDACRQQPELSVLCWWEWPEGLRLRQEDVLSEFKITHKALIDEFITTQYLFEMQWKTLRVGRVGSRGVGSGQFCQHQNRMNQLSGQTSYVTRLSQYSSEFKKKIGRKGVKKGVFVAASGCK
jgi:hypothetical protein